MKWNIQRYYILPVIVVILVILYLLMTYSSISSSIHKTLKETFDPIQQLVLAPSPAPSPSPSPAAITTTTNKLDLISPGGAIYSNQQQLLQQINSRILSIQNMINQINSYLPKQITDIVPGVISTGDQTSAMIQIRNVPYPTKGMVLVQNGSNPVQTETSTIQTGKWFIDMVLPQAPQGAAGPKGVPGPQGVAGVMGDAGSAGGRGPWGN